MSLKAPTAARDLGRALQHQRLRARVAAQPFGGGGEEADRGGEAPGEDVGHRRHEERREHEPQGDALLPGVQAERRLGPDDRPVAVGLPNRHLERRHQEVILADPLAGDALADDPEHAAVREGPDVGGDEHMLDRNAEVLGQAPPDARRLGALHHRPRRLFHGEPLQRPALREGRPRAAEGLLDLRQPVEVGQGRGQVEDQEQADGLGRHQRQAGQSDELDEQRACRPRPAALAHVRFTLAVNM